MTAQETVQTIVTRILSNESPEIVIAQEFPFDTVSLWDTLAVSTSLLTNLISAFAATANVEPLEIWERLCLKMAAAERPGN